jgi:hypothetical protein
MNEFEEQIDGLLSFGDRPGIIGDIPTRANSHSTPLVSYDQKLTSPLV